MANQFSASLSVQNTIQGGSTVPKVRHRLPLITASIPGLDSIVTVCTGTGTTVLAVSGTGLTIGGTAVKHPITGAAFNVDAIHGWTVYVERAAAGTAPTGTVAINAGGMGKWISDGNIPLPEGGFLSFHNPASAAAASSEGLQVILTGTTGYKVSVIVWFEQA